MATGNKTFYEILGVRRGATSADIDRAYARIKADMQKETSVPNPRLAAMAKVAYETLSDPESRAEYNESLGIGETARRSGGVGPTAMALVAVAIIAIAGAGYYFLARNTGRPALGSGEKALAPTELLQEVEPHIGRLQGALVSGEVRELGAALATADNEMVATCRGIAPGMLLTLTQGATSYKAELARVNDDLDICTLTVKGAAAGLKMRSGVPAPQEKLQAVLLHNGPAETRQVRVARALENPKGQLLELKAAAALPNGTPVFDGQARLVGLVTSPHDLGEGVIAVLGASRIAQARANTAAAAAPAAAPSPAAPPTAATASAPSPAERSAPSAAAPVTRGSGAALVDDGFATLWKEDSNGHLIEVLDNPKTGSVGIPLAYWTLWSGRDGSRAHAPHCLVTYGAEREVIADYDQTPLVPTPDGYWFCALTRFQVELDDLEKGEYHFTIFVNGKAVGEKSIMVETRFFTPTMKIALVLAVGLGLLAFMRRNKVVRL